MIPQLSEQELLRRESLQKLIELGIEPFPAAQFDITATAADIKENYKEEILEDYDDLEQDDILATLAYTIEPT